jgi:hypothetical protein
MSNHFPNYYSKFKRNCAINIYHVGFSVSLCVQINTLTIINTWIYLFGEVVTTFA